MSRLLTKDLLTASQQFRADKRFRYNLLAMAKGRHIPRQHLESLFAGLCEQFVAHSQRDIIQVAASFRPQQWLALTELLDCWLAQEQT